MALCRCLVNMSKAGEHLVTDVEWTGGRQHGVPGGNAVGDEAQVQMGPNCDAGDEEGRLGKGGQGLHHPPSAYNVQVPGQIPCVHYYLTHCFLCTMKAGK